MELSVQINVCDEVKALDVFLSYVKRWAKEVRTFFQRAVSFVFNTNNYSTWKAVSVRGPDVKVSIYTSLSAATFN